MGDESLILSRRGVALLVVGVVAAAVRWAGAADPPTAPPRIQDPSATQPRAVVEVVEALVAARPADLRSLEQAIGRLGRDPTDWEQAVGPLRRRRPSPAVLEARVDLAIDIFHVDPQRVTDPGLASYALRLPGPEDATGRILARAFGPGEPVDPAGQTNLLGEVGAVQRFAAGGRRDPGSPLAGAGDFFLTPDTAGLWHELSWHAAEPAWAIPERDAEEGRRLVATLIRAAREGFRPRVFEETFGVFERQGGSSATVAIHGETWRIELTPRVVGAGSGGDGAPGPDAQPESIVLRLRRPLTAEESRELLAGLGIEAPRVEAPDVHQVSRRIVDGANPRSEETGYALPARAGYVVAISVLAEGLEKLPQAAEARDGPWWSAEGARVSGLRAFWPRR